MNFMYDVHHVIITVFSSAKSLYSYVLEVDNAVNSEGTQFLRTVLCFAATLEQWPVLLVELSILKLMDLTMYKSYA